MATSVRFGSRKAILAYLVDGVPVLDPITKTIKAQSGIVDKIRYDIVAEKPSIFVLQDLWSIKVENRRHRLNPGRYQPLNELVIVLDAFFVDRRVSAPLGPDAWPSDREAVGLSTVLLQKLDVIFPQIVGAAGIVAFAGVVL